VTSSGGRGARGRASLTRKAQALALREGLFPQGSRVLVMVSGGQDSLALLDVLTSLTGRAGGPAATHALHINHHLRGTESDDDEALVVRACGERGVSLTVSHRPIAKAEGNVQERAREARREAALQAAAQHRCDRIALGHTADDQAETILYRLGRYGGLAAFRAMLPCDPPWVRPLLECRRAETEAYCREQGFEFARDRGNAYPGYARTALREVVLPAWEAALPGAVDAAARAATVAAEMETVLDGLLAEAERRVAVAALPGSAGALPGADRDAGSHPGLSVAGLLALEPPLRRLLLHRWLEGRASTPAQSGGCDPASQQPSGSAASRASVLALEALLHVPGSGERDLAGGLRGVKEYDRLTVEAGRRPAHAAPAPAPVALPVPGGVEWGGFWVSAGPAERFMAPDTSREAFVDARSLAGAVEIRGPRPGDRFRPLGSPGTRKLQDLFVDLRVPAAARAGTPLVVCAGRIIWVCGLVVADEGRIARDTTSIVRLEVKAAEE
jgi:tRNA(Ile)-lysidine synthase